VRASPGSASPRSAFVLGFWFLVCHTAGTTRGEGHHPEFCWLSATSQMPPGLLRKSHTNPRNTTRSCNQAQYQRPECCLEPSGPAQIHRPTWRTPPAMVRSLTHVKADHTIYLFRTTAVQIVSAITRLQRGHSLSASPVGPERCSETVFVDTKRCVRDRGGGAELSGPSCRDGARSDWRTRLLPAPSDQLLGMYDYDWPGRSQVTSSGGGHLPRAVARGDDMRWCSRRFRRAHA
jgi:hypothetical protein